MMRPAVVCGGLLALVAAFSIFPLIALDLPADLATGRIILDQGGVPPTNVLLHTQPDFPVVNDRWLHQVVVHLADRTVGTAGLHLLRALLALAIALAAYALARSLASENAPGAAGFAVLLAVPLLVHRLGLRPELWTYLFTAVYLRVLLGRSRRRQAMLLALIPLQVLWANLDAGFGLGPILVLVAGAPELVRLRWRPLGLAAILVAVSMLHPSGSQLLVHVVATLPTAAGLAPIWSAGVPWTLPAIGTLIALALCALGLIRARGRVPVPLGATAALLVAIGVLAHPRLPLTGLGLVALVTAAPPLPPRLTVAVTPVLTILGTILVCLGPLSDPAADGRSFGLGWSKRAFPIESTEFLVTDRPPGEVFNDIASGGYYAYRALPHKRAYIDSNAAGYPPAFLVEYGKVLELETPHRATKRHRVSHFLLRHDSAATRSLVPALFQDEGLIVAFFDSAATVFMAREVAPGIQDRRGAWIAEVLPHVHDTLFPRRRQGEAILRQAAKLAEADPETALALIRQAVNLDPWNAHAFRLAARAYHAQKDTEREVVAWRRAALLEGQRLRMKR